MNTPLSPVRRKLWLPEDLESVPCPFCSGSTLETVCVRPDGLTAVQCLGCHLCYLSPRPRPESIARLYESDYFSNPGDGPSGYTTYSHESSRAQLAEEAARRLSLLRQVLRPPQKRLLEVGTATGELASLLARVGAHIVATDISGFAIDIARGRHPNVDFRCGDWSVVPERSFDAIVAFEVIEHVPSPQKFFAEAAARLLPRGLLILSTPNYGRTKELGAERWLGFASSFEHLFFFDVATLTAFARREGFEPVTWYTGSGSGLVAAGNAAGPSGPVSMTTIARRLVRPIRRMLRSYTSLPLHGFVERVDRHHQLVMVFCVA